MTDGSHKHRVASAFGAAAHYDLAGAVQRVVADALADRIAETGLRKRPAILEIGCGTGFLTSALASRIGEAAWTVTDIAPEMVERARATGVPGQYRVLDGERIEPGGTRYDLICSSLAFQWFEDLPAAIARLAAHLAPGGLLAFSTMAEGSFAEWRDAHRAEGLVAGTPDYPGAAALLAMAPAELDASVELADHVPDGVGAHIFLRGLKALGAAVPPAGRVPLSAAAMRRVMARFDGGGGMATYRIAYCLFQAPIERDGPRSSS